MGLSSGPRFETPHRSDRHASDPSDRGHTVEDRAPCGSVFLASASVVAVALVRVALASLLSACVAVGCGGRAPETVLDVPAAARADDVLGDLAVGEPAQADVDDVRSGDPPQGNDGAQAPDVPTAPDAQGDLDASTTTDSSPDLPPLMDVPSAPDGGQDRPSSDLAVTDATRDVLMDVAAVTDALPDGSRLFCPPPPTPTYGTCGTSAHACRCRCDPTDLRCEYRCTAEASLSCQRCYVEVLTACGCAMEGADFLACSRAARTTGVDGGAACANNDCVELACASPLNTLLGCLSSARVRDAACRRAFDGCNGRAACPTDGGLTDAGPADTCRVVDCQITACSARGFSYTCATPTANTYEVRDSRCGLRSLGVNFTNGFSVGCSITCGGSSGSCADNTGATCAF